VHVGEDFARTSFAGEAQQIVRRNPLKRRNLAQKIEARLPYSFFIMAHQSLGYSKLARHSLLTEPSLLAQQRKNAGEFLIHPYSSESKNLIAINSTDCNIIHEMAIVVKRSPEKFLCLVDFAFPSCKFWPDRVK
jgi:hypothetical protein